MEKPSFEFFATLGQYVYQYIDSEGKAYYTGKGNGDRCWAHVVEKGLIPNTVILLQEIWRSLKIRRTGSLSCWNPI